MAKITVVESDNKYKVLLDEVFLGFLEDNLFSPGLPLVPKNAKKEDGILVITLGVNEVPEGDKEVRFPMPEITQPKPPDESSAPNSKIQTLIDKRRAGQTVNRKLTIVEQRRQSGPDRIKNIIAQRRKGGI